MRVAVYCSSSERVPSAYLDAAGELGSLIAQRGHSLVYGATRHGSMHRLARGVIDGGAEAVGVAPTMMRHLPMEEGLSQLWWAQSMQERTMTMARLADAHIALPGGLGTLEELAEVICHAGLDIIRGPVVLVDVDGFYAPLLDWLRRLEREAFIPHPLEEVVLLAPTPAAALDLVERHHVVRDG